MSAVKRALVLLGRTSEVLTHPSSSAQRLADYEIERIERFADTADRDSYRAAHLLVRTCAAMAGVGPGSLMLAQTCVQCGGSHGQPRFPDFPDVHVSLAHTHGAVIAAVSPAPIGVDIEKIRALGVDDIAQVLRANEQAHLQRHPQDAVTLWCRKEATVKASGEGMAGMADVDALAGTWTEGRADGFQYCVESEAAVDVGRLR